MTVPKVIERDGDRPILYCRTPDISMCHTADDWANLYGLRLTHFEFHSSQFTYGSGGQLAIYGELIRGLIPEEHTGEK